METITVRTPPEVFVKKAAMTLVAGLPVGALTWTLLWSYDVPGAVPWGSGAGAATSLLVGLVLLVTAVTRLEVDESSLVVTRAVGGTRRLALSEHRLRVFGAAEGALFQTVLVACDGQGRDHRIPLHFGPAANQRVLTHLARARLVE